jgi:Ca2+-binding EF-hand superfamily protein
LKSYFDKADTNKDGFLTPKEIMKAWHLKKPVVDEIMKKYDTNKDGKISFNEYKKMWIF